MLTTASLNRDNYLIDDGNDYKVIVRDLADVPGGRTLDMTGWTDDVVRAGHIIKYNSATEVYSPLAVSSGDYVSLDTNEEYIGVLKATVLKDKPFAAIMTMGEVNAAASPYPVTSTIKAGLPAIKFLP